MLYVTRLVAVLSLSLLAGGYFNGAYIMVPAMRAVSASSFIEAQQSDTRVGHIRYRALVNVTAILLLALLIQLRPRAGAEFWLTLIALILVVVATFITIRFVVPINDLVHTWNHLSPPDNWTAFRDKWGNYHLARTMLVCAALVVQFVAVIPRVRE
jgi:uncharacterized membrane protein